MRSQTARGGKSGPGNAPHGSPGPVNGSRRNSQKGTSPQAPDTFIRNKLVDLVATSCGKTVVATVASGAQYRGVMSSADISPSGTGPLSVVLVRAALVAKPVFNEKSNVDDKLPPKLVIQAKDLIDIEVVRSAAKPPVEAKEKKEPEGVEKVSEEQKPEKPALESKTVAPKAAEPKAAELKQAEAKPKAAELKQAETKPAEAKPVETKVKPAKYEVPKGKITESQGFKTDRDISSGHKFQERELQRWVPDADTPLVELDSGSTGAWDQFKANEEKFGVESTYDEHLYTTKINTEAKDYQQRLRRAEQVAREIEGSASTDRHVLEERNVAVDDRGLDEEDKYSGVIQDTADPRGHELMAALRNASISSESQPAAVDRAAHYHNDPAIVSSSAAKSRDGISAAPLPPKPSGVGDAVRLNAQSEFNALREFSANFKIPHKMPNDLLPILANDKVKQDQILKKQRDLAEAKDAKAAEKKSVPEAKKPVKTFKLNPKAAAFTPMSSMSPTPPKATYNKSPKNQSPRMHTQRPYTGSAAGGSRRHFQISAAEFFGGADKVPTAKGQKEKSERFHRSFNLFRTAQEKHADSSTPLILDKAFKTPPTWDSNVDQTYEELVVDLSTPEPSPGMAPNMPFMGSPMRVPAAPMGPVAGFAGAPAAGKFPISPQMHNPMAAAHIQQQFHAAMMYQGFQPGMPPGQPQMMYGPPGMDPQFMQGGFMAPGFSGASSPVGVVPPYGGGSPVNQGRRMSSKRGSQVEK